MRWIYKLGRKKDKMAEVMNLDEVYEWATSEENVWKFLENVKWNILVNTPNKFVTINEIAKKLNWQFEEHAPEMSILCLPLSLSPEIEIEHRKDEEYSLEAYKYKQDIEKEGNRLSRQKSYQSFIINVVEQGKQYEKEGTSPRIWSAIYRGMLYYTFLIEVVKFFKDVKREEELEKGDKRLEEVLKQLKTTKKTDWDIKGDL